MLTETQIRKAKTPYKPTKLADERGMAFASALRRASCLQISLRWQREIARSGSLPRFVLAKPRDARDDARKALAQGIDPSAARQQQKREKAEAGANDSKRSRASGWRTSGRSGRRLSL